MMKKFKTLHNFTDANIDGEKLEKANKNIENAINGKAKKKEK